MTDMSTSSLKLEVKSEPEKECFQFMFWTVDTSFTTSVSQMNVVTARFHFFAF